MAVASTNTGLNRQGQARGQGQRIDEFVEELLEAQRSVKQMRNRIIIVLGFLGITSALAVIGFALAVTSTINLLTMYEAAEVNNYLLCALVTGLLLLALFTAELLASMVWTDGHSYRLSNAVSDASVQDTPAPSTTTSPPISSSTSYQSSIS